MGAVLYRRFFKEVQTVPLIILGLNNRVDPQSKVWRGFLKTALYYQVQWDRIYTSSEALSLELFFKKVQPLNWPQIIKDLRNKKKVLVIMDSHKIPFNDKIFLTKIKPYKKMIVGIEKFILSSDDENLIECKSAGSQQELNFLDSPSCAALQFSKTHYRKKHNRHKKMAAMNLYLNNYYYLFIAN